MRVVRAWAALGAVAWALGRVAVWPGAAGPETPVLAVATGAAYACLAWLALVLLVVTAGVRVRLPGRAFVERVVGVAAVGAVAGAAAMTAGPAAADGGPFDRLASPAPRAAPRAAPRSAPPPAVVVAPGDTLWAIAARSLDDAAPPAVAAEWPRWYAANRSVVGPDPGLIRPGQRLVAP